MTTVRRVGWPALVVSTMAAVFAAWFFSHRLDEEKPFGDEIALIAQTYYFRLVRAGDFHHPDWVHPAAYDHGPVYKYLMGSALVATGHELPTSTGPWEQWMVGKRELPRRDALMVCRLAMLAGAVLGCLLAFWFGWILGGTATGLVAAGLLIASPLYMTHARRAMADDLAQALVLATLVSAAAIARSLSPAAFRWSSVALGVVLGGIAAGLAVATKLNAVVGALAAAGTALTSLLFFPAVRSHVGSYFRQSLAFVLSVAGIGILGVAIMIGIDPYYWAKPDFSDLRPGPAGCVILGGQTRTVELVEDMKRVGAMRPVDRMRHLLDHRTTALKEAPTGPLAAYSLPNAAKRAEGIVREGMGRWSFLGRLRQTNDATQPAGFEWALFFPLVLAGLWFSLGDGYGQVRDGRLPTSWLLFAWAGVETTMLLMNLSLNFDRYYLGVVAWSSIAAALGIRRLADSFFDRMVLKPPGD